jgi:hypothetical protein
MLIDAHVKWHILLFKHNTAIDAANQPVCFHIRQITSNRGFTGVKRLGDLPDADFDDMADGDCEVVLEDELGEDVLPGIDTDVNPIDLADDATAETV